MRLFGLLIALALGTATGVKAAPPIEAYGALPTVERLQISPSGKLVALFFNKNDQHIMVIRRLDGDHKILRTSTLNDRVGGALWADDDHLYVNTHRTFNTGTQYVQEGGFLFLINLKTNSSRQVVPDEDKEVIGLPEFVTHANGHTYGYFQVGRRLYRQDIDSDQLIEVARSGENQGDFVVTPDAKIMARMQYLDHGRKWTILKGQESSTVLASGEAEVGGGRVLGLGRTPDTVLIGDDQNGSLSGIREINLETGVVSKPLVQGNIDAAPIHDKKTFLLIGFYLGGFVEDTYFLDPDLQHRWESVKAAFKGQVVRLASVNDDRSRWIVNVQGDHNAGEYFLIDLAEHKAISIEKSYPDIKPADVGAFAWFDYKAQDGTAEKALVTLPPGYTMQTARNLPAAVLPHGGPQGRDNLGFDWWAQALASRGYVVIQPQFRGSGGYGQAFEQAGWGQWGKLMQTDVSDALKAVVAKGIVDPTRACIVGWSYGGYATLAGVTVQNGIYRCAAAGAAVSDLNAMLVWTRDREGGDLGYAVRYWKKSMALKGENDPAGVAVSPAKLASRVTVPLMVIHGRQDTTVPLEQGQEMVAAMRAAGKPVEFVILENETHHIESASTRTKMLNAMIGFLERNNPPTMAATHASITASDTQGR